MRANSPSALFASVTLHLVMAAVVFALGILATRQAPPPPVIFELVAGEPTDAAERGVPAPVDVKLNVPKVKLPPEPVRETRVEPPPQKQVVKEAPKPVEKKAPPKQIMKKAPPKEEPKMSYEEFVRQHGAPKTPTNTPPRQVKAPQIDTSKVVANARVSGERGRADSRAEADAMAVYIAALRDRLRDAHEQTKPGGLGDAVSAEVSFFLAASGQIDNVRIVRSSGHPEFDQSVLAAFRRITWPGPRPDKRNETVRLTFRMRE